MFRNLRGAFAVGLFLVAGCATAKVVREGSGWRELEGTQPGQTQIEITTDDPKVLAELARSAPDPRIRTQAALRVKDPAVLAEIVKQETDPAIRLRIVDQLSDVKLLRELAASDPDEKVKQAAQARAEVLRTIDSKHPEYAGWAACKPGNWIRMKIDLKMDESRSSIEIVRKLLECGPERAVVEQKVVGTGRGPQGAYRDLLGRFDVAFGRKVEDEGDLLLPGRTLKCKWVRYNFQRGGDVAQIRRWILDEVPGGVARFDMEVSPEGQPLMHLTAVATAWEKR